MTCRPANPKNRAGKVVFRFSGWFAAWMFLGGNLATEHQSDLQAAVVRPANVFLRSPVLPADLHRVAVLPLTAESQGDNLPEGCEALQPVLLDEVVRTRRFEVVTVNAEILRGSSGRLAWTGTEALPSGFFDSLQREYGCDALLFCQLTAYHAYSPLVIGWRLKLVDAHTHQILWSADEVFESRPKGPGALSDAMEFLYPHDSHLEAEGKQWAEAHSPRQFGRYAVAQLLRTLPER